MTSTLADDRNLSVDLTEWAAEQPAAPALILPGRILSYAGLDALVWRGARLLAAAGVHPGTVAGLAFRSEVLLALAVLATTRLGATFSVLSREESEREHLRVDLVIRDVARRAATDTEPEVVFDHDGLRAFSAVPEPSLLPMRPAHAWQYLTGSGSTGTPKIMPITHRVQRARALAARTVRALTPSDRFLSLPDLTTHFARTQMFYALHAGASFCLLPRPATHAVDLCRALRPTILDAATVHLDAMLASVRSGEEASAREALGSVRMLMVTSSAVSQAMRRRVREVLTDRLTILYSTNESSPIACASGPELLALSDTVGRILPGVEARILGADDMPVPPGQVGVLEVRSAGMIDGYLDDPESTRAAFRDGWFRTGDLVRMAPDGQLVYCGRSDQMMIMNGINIYPAEIERALCEHPAVADAAVFKVAHPVHQDLPCAVVALYPGSILSEDALMDFAQRRLGVRRPRVIVMLHAVPRNPQGKLIRARAMEAIFERLRTASGPGA